LKIAVIGLGYVGVTTALLFCKLNHCVVGVDTDASKLAQMQKGRLPMYEPGLRELLQSHLADQKIEFTSDIEHAIKTCHILFITVGTPARTDGSTDLRYIREVSQSIGCHQNSAKIVVMKSTAPIGTSEKVQEWITQQQAFPLPVTVVCNPEFLREGTALHDALHPDRIVIGAENPEAAQTIKDLYDAINSPKLVTNLRTAELIKYASNAFLALKVSYINEIARLCDSFGVDVEDVADGIGLDQRIGRSFLQAGIGWGGSCFPKDITSLMKMFARKKIQASIVPAIQRVNETQIEYYIHRLESFLGGLQGKTVSVLGVAFKPNTDDIRDAPAVKFIRDLHRRGARLKVYDPVVTKLRRLNMSAEVCLRSRSTAKPRTASVRVQRSSQPSR
jgi:UDPglucose 6-dehydrogenase